MGIGTVILFVICLILYVVDAILEKKINKDIDDWVKSMRESTEKEKE